MITTDERVFQQAKLASIYALDVVLDVDESEMGNRFIRKIVAY